MVAFTDDAYFRSRYCVEEWGIALAAYRALHRRGITGAALEQAALPVVVALPPAAGRRRRRAGAGAAATGELAWLPPEVRSVNWPEATATADLAELVRGRAAVVSETVRERLDRLGELAEVRARWRESSMTLPPLRLGPARVYHQAGLPESIGDAFVGRSRELWELHTLLAPPPEGLAAPTVLVEGGAGTGKTCLALEYVHRCGPASFPGGLLWLNAAVPGDRLEAQMHGMLPARCAAVSWAPSTVSPGQDIQVRCTAGPEGAGADTPFMLTYAIDGPLHTDPIGPHAGYVLANDPTAASYDAPAPFSLNGYDYPNPIERLGTGRYRAHFTGLGYQPDGVQVTAAGATSHYCKVSTFFVPAAGPDDAVVDVACFDPRGAPADTAFSLAYFTVEPT